MNHESRKLKTIDCRLKTSSGFGLVEVVVGVALLTIAFLSLATTYNFYLVRTLANESTVKASFLLEEGMEAIKVIRDNGWTTNIASLSTGQIYSLVFYNGAWVSTTTAEVIDGFTRSFLLSSVYRDGNSDIADSGTLDSNAKKATMTVSWFDAGTTTTKSISTYITNLFDS